MLFFLLCPNVKAQKQFERDSVIRQSQYSDTATSKSNISNYQDSLEETEYPSKGGYGIFRIGIGHHDNLTKEKGPSVTKLKTGNVTWFLYGELGIFYKNVYLSIFGTPYMFAIPNSKSDRNGYVHEFGLISMGVKTHFFLFPKKSKFNLLPTLGYALFRESAVIYDPSGNNPDLLDMTFKDDAPIYGFSIQFSLEKGEGLVSLDYLREAHSIGANRYRIQVRGFFSGDEKSSVLKGFASWAFEYVVWNDKRRDWFIMSSVSIEESEVKVSK